MLRFSRIRLGSREIAGGGKHGARQRVVDHTLRAVRARHVRHIHVRVGQTGLHRRGRTLQRARREVQLL